jgi:ligand-binding SRPBCC domain-containing protein
VPRFELVTLIHASRERCFDLSRDIDLHVRSMSDSNERAVAGRTSGLIGLGEEVTWQARHFGVQHRHRSRITEYDRPRHFRDIQVAGRFRSFVHDHFFEEKAGVTHMRDVLSFESPLGILGKIADRLVLDRYLRELIAERNRVIKAEAERA